MLKIIALESKLPEMWAKMLPLIFAKYILVQTDVLVFILYGL